MILQNNIYIYIYICIYVYICMYVNINNLFPDCVKSASSQYKRRAFICNIWTNKLNIHFSNKKFHVYSQSSGCTNMNQIHNTDFFLANYVKKRLMNVPTPNKILTKKPKNSSKNWTSKTRWNVMLRGQHSLHWKTTTKTSKAIENVVWSTPLKVKWVY